MLLDFGEDVLLDVELFEDGLDDPVAIREVGLVSRSTQQCTQSVQVVCVEPPLFVKCVELATNVVEPFVDARLVEVSDDDGHFVSSKKEQRELARHETGA